MCIIRTIFMKHLKQRILFFHIQSTLLSSCESAYYLESCAASGFLSMKFDIPRTILGRGRGYCCISCLLSSKLHTGHCYKVNTGYRVFFVRADFADDMRKKICVQTAQMAVGAGGGGEGATDNFKSNGAVLSTSPTCLKESVPFNYQSLHLQL